MLTSLVVATDVSIYAVWTTTGVALPMLESPDVYFIPPPPNTQSSLTSARTGQVLVLSRLHDTTGCQAGLTTGMTTGLKKCKFTRKSTAQLSQLQLHVC